MDIDSNRVLYEKNANEKRLIASTTKIMTALLALESNKMDNLVEAKEEILKMYGTSIYLSLHEKMKLRDLVYGLMLRSGNDAAIVIATYLSGSEEEFVKKMNKKAKEIGMVNTTFQNAHGLDEETKNYSTAHDMALLSSYVYKNFKEYRTITKTYKYQVQTEEKSYLWYNRNKLLKQYPGVDGLKTGFTKEAGYCIVTTCKKKDLRLIGVVMNEDKPQTRNEDMKGLLNFGFSKYQQVKLYQKGEVIDTVKVKDMVEQKINVVSHKNLYYLSEKTNQEKFKKKIVFDSLQLPINQNKSIGKLILYNKDKAVASYPLYSEINVKKMSFLDKLLRVYKSLI